MHYIHSLKMDKQQISYFIASFLASLFLLLAVVVPRWPCGGLFDACSYNDPTHFYLKTGISYIMALCCTVLIKVVIVFSMISNQGWMKVCVTILSVVASVISMGATIHFLVNSSSHEWSICLGTVATTLSLRLCASFIYAMVNPPEL